MMVNPLPADMTLTTLIVVPGGNRTSASPGMSENVVMSRPWLWVKLMMKNVRSPLSPQNCGVSRTLIAVVVLTHPCQTTVRPSG